MGQQIWHPDTCECVIEYNIDSITGDTTPIRTINSCPAHSALTPVQRHTVLHEENPRRNKLRHRLMTQLPNIFSVVDPITGEVRWKDDAVTVSWSGIGQSRVLQIDVSQTSLTTQQKTATQAWCDANLGIGRVLIIG